jgi:DNA-binding winged helix-turn-helix (wHTH) protein
VSADRILLTPRFEIDLEREELRTLAGERVHLRPRSFAVLRLLATNAGRLVTKDEILERVWDDAVVAEEALTQCIADIRRALGDAERKVVRTIPRRGYLLVTEPAPEARGPAPLQAEDRAETSLAQAIAAEVVSPRRWLMWTAGPRVHAWTAVAAVCVALVAAYLLTLWAASSAPNLPTSASGNHPFDGLWRVVQRGNEYCFHRRGIMLWTIVEGRVRHDGDGDGAVSIAGELSFKRAGRGDPSKLVVWSVRLDGHRGSGTYYLEQTKCAGATEMTRLAPGAGPVE